MFVWVLQAVWCLWNTVPMVVSNSVQTAALVPSDFVGMAMMLIGFTLEVVADRQKTTFRLNSSNKDTFIKTGLWALCRHPNYFGEILLQFGTCTLALSSSLVY
mmetsp:Transcript_76989/g.166560  ORF Transcript_76989/g.166560 Transcript_76989/m.166560 type:complete len:103 (-) Transcript_76989:232-540(-)